MENIVVLTPSALPRQTLVDHIASLGGEWQSGPHLDHGFVKKGEATVYVYCEKTPPEAYYTPAEYEQIRQELGADPAMVISIHAGHAEGSLDLAKRVADSMVRSWGGFVDFNE